MFTKTALKDGNLLKTARLDRKANELLDILEKDPFQYPPAFEKLSGKWQDRYSRRINQQHRIVYRVDTDAKKVYIIRMWTHYDL